VLVAMVVYGDGDGDVNVDNTRILCNDFVFLKFCACYVSVCVLFLIDSVNFPCRT